MQAIAKPSKSNLILSTVKIIANIFLFKRLTIKVLIKSSQSNQSVVVFQSEKDDYEGRFCPGLSSIVCCANLRIRNFDQRICRSRGRSLLLPADDVDGPDESDPGGREERARFSEVSLRTHPQTEDRVDLQVWSGHKEGQHLPEVQRSGDFNLQSVFLLWKAWQVGTDSSFHHEQEVIFIFGKYDLLLRYHVFHEQFKPEQKRQSSLNQISFFVWMLTWD